MKKILLLSKYSRMGASSRLRTMQYVPFLTDNNFSVTQQSLFNDEYLSNLYAKKKVSKLLLVKLFLQRLVTIFKAKKYDLLWIEYELIPYFPAWFGQLFHRFNIRYIVDYDDAIFHNYDLSSNKYIKRFLSNKIDLVMKNASAVVVGNDYLANRARQAGAKSIYLVPTVVDKTRYQIKKTSIIDNQSDQITIGWIGSPSTQKYIAEMADVFSELAKSFRFKLVLVGANNDIYQQLSNIDIEILPWSESKEADFIKQFDIGIMPLIDGPWEKGKCGYKLIQYMACGVPVIASAVGVNVDIVTNNNCGLLANNRDKWLLALSSLAGDSALRYQLGTAGHHAVERHYCLQVQQIRLSEIFNSVLE